eukprot:5524631-Pyramimonas_sp.AAC.3
MPISRAGHAFDSGCDTIGGALRAAHKLQGRRAKGRLHSGHVLSLRLRWHAKMSNVCTSLFPERARAQGSLLVGKPNPPVPT